LLTSIQIPCTNNSSKLLLLLRRLLFNKTSKFFFEVFLWRSTWRSIPMIGNRTVPTLKEFPTRPHLRRLLLRRQQQSCASVCTSARLHALDRRLRSRGRYEGRDPTDQDVDPKLIGTWIHRSLGCGSGDHRDVDPVFEDLGFMRYPRSQGPKPRFGTFFFPNFFFFLFFLFSQYIFSIVNL